MSIRLRREHRLLRILTRDVERFEASEQGLEILPILLELGVVLRVVLVQERRLVPCYIVLDHLYFRRNECALKRRRPLLKMNISRIRLRMLP